LLQEAIAGEHWYDDLRDNPNLQLLHDMSELEQLVEACKERRGQAMANTVPIVKTLQPVHQEVSSLQPGGGPCQATERTKERP
jgi:hypothetical protein